MDPRASDEVAYNADYNQQFIFSVFGFLIYDNEVYILFDRQVIMVPTCILLKSMTLLAIEET